MAQNSGSALAPKTPHPETIMVKDTRVACDGGDGALGHPRVFLEMGEAHEVVCPYCDRLYVLEDGAGH